MDINATVRFKNVITFIDCICFLFLYFVKNVFLIHKNAGLAKKNWTIKLIIKNHRQ